MQLFWLHGYDGVSTQMLVEAMGINRKSVYSEFGNKQKLYHAALDRYLCEVIPQIFAVMNSDEANLQSVFEVLRRFSDAVGRKGPEKGCMLCNAASETAHHDGAVRVLVDDYFRLIKSSFENALGAAVRKGELTADLDIGTWSSSLATSVIGMFVMIRSRVDGAILTAAADLAVAQLRLQRRARDVD